MVDLDTKIKAGAKIIDVRTTEEFTEDHYPSALNIPVDQLRQRLTEIGGKNTSIVLDCASGARSAVAARLLKSAGYTDVVKAGGLDDMPRN